MQSLGTNPNIRGIIDNQHFCDNPKVNRVNHCIGSKVKGRRCLFFFVFIKQAVNSLNSRMGVDGLYRVGDECCSVFKCIPHNNGKYYY